MGIRKTWVGRSFVFNERLEVGARTWHLRGGVEDGGRETAAGSHGFGWIRMDWAGSVVAVLVGCAIGDF